MRKSIFVFSLIVFFGIIFFGGSNKVYAQFTCDPNTSPQISTCGGPPDTTYQTAPLCSFAYYPYGTFAVYKEVYACTGHQTTCYSNLTGQAVSQSSCTVDCVPAPSSYETCSGVATCGNNKKDTNECCDPTAPGSSPSTCDSSCACIGGAPSCGDGVCNGYEDANNCSQDCSGGTPTSLCPSNPIITNVYGATDKVLYQGDSVNLFYSIESNNTDNQSYNVSSIGCPPGATCSGSGGMVGGGDPPDIRSYTISNTGSTPTRSDNPISLKVSSASDPTCSYDLVYNLNIKPSRKSVCDGAWHEVPPYPYPYAVYSGPFARFDGTNMKATVNADYIAMTSPLTWQRANFSLLCRYLGGSGDTCTWDQPTQMPNTGYPYGAATYGWQMLGAPYGSTASATDGGGRTYTLQRSGNFVQYKCDVPVVQYALTVSKNGTGSGTVTSAPAGISCGSGSGCSASYANGTSVSLSASAASGSVFTGWGGACSGSGACNVSMSQARSVTATFNTAATCDAFMSPASNAVVSNVTSSGYRITWTPQSGSHDNKTHIRIASNLNQTGATQVGTYLGTWTYGSCPNPPLTGASQCIVNVNPSGTISTYDVTGAEPNTTYYNRLPTICPDGSAYEDYVFTVTTPPAAGGTCDTTPGNNFMKGCLYDGINFSSLSATSIIESALPSPAPTNANPIPYKNWGTSGPNTSNVDTFSIRWKGTYNFAAGDYVFTIGGDDGVRAYFDDNNDGIPNGGNGVYIVNDWSNHGYRTTASPSTAVTAGPHTLVLEYYDDGVDAKYSLSWTSTPSAASCDPNTIGTNKLVGCTYNGLNFNTLSGFAPDGNTAGANTDNFTPLNNTSWGNGAPNASTNADNFTVRWKGNFNFSGGTYDFSVTNLDDGARVYLDGVLIRNLWSGFCCTTHNFSQVISAGQHRIDLEFQEIGGGANVGLSWAKQAVAPPPATANISANPTTVPYNTASTLSWSYSNATSCTLTPPGSLGGYPSASGSFSTGNLTAPRTYTLSCDPGSVSPFVTVNVQAQSTFNLTVVRSGQGTVTSNPVGISCGATCGYTYPADTSVSLTATPASGRIFVGWGGACSGRGSCSVLLNSSKIVFANFAVDPGFKEF